MNYLFFDFDGTLADTSKGIYFSFKKACKKINYDCPSFIDFKKQIGPPIHLIIKNFFPTIKENDLILFQNAFREDYDTRSYKIVRWYEGINKSLIVLKKNYKFAVVSNKPTLLCRKLLKSKSLIKYFDLVMGIDYCANIGKSNFKDKSYAINYALKILNVNPSQVTYIGDTLSDMKNANYLGIQFIAAKYGFYNWSDNNYPNMYIDKFSEIEKVIECNKKKERTL